MFACKFFFTKAIYLSAHPSIHPSTTYLSMCMCACINNRKPFCNALLTLVVVLITLERCRFVSYKCLGVHSLKDLITFTVNRSWNTDPEFAFYTNTFYFSVRPPVLDLSLEGQCSKPDLKTRVQTGLHSWESYKGFIWSRLEASRNLTLWYQTFPETFQGN